MSDENKPAPSGSLFNFSLSDIFGAGKGIEKLMTAVGGGAGRVADGVGEVANVKWLDKTRADNEAYRTQVIGDAQTRVMEGRARAVAALAREGQHLQSMSIVEGGVNAQLAGVSSETRDLYERTLRRMTYENAMQQINRETVIAHAAAELAGDGEHVADKPVDPDWMMRLLRTVQDISNEEMQLLFGKILAGEVKQPGSFSARTVDLLATLEQDEAKLFVKLCAFRWERGEEMKVIIFDYESNEYNAPLLSFPELQYLRELGLIELADTFGNGYGIRLDFIVMSYGKDFVKIEAPVRSEGEKRSVPTGLLLLTNIGRQLAKVCHPTLNPLIMEYAISRWAKKGCNVTRLTAEDVATS